MKIVRLSKKVFREKFGDVDAMTLRDKGMEPTIYIPGRASTKEILHEIYHATESPNLEEIEKGKIWQTARESALEELRAQEFAAEKIGLEELPWNMVIGIANNLLHGGYKPAAVMGAITQALKDEGYSPLERANRQDLWTFLRRRYDEEGGID